MRLLPCLALTLGLAATGCETFTPSICNRDTPAIEYGGGQTENGVYMSSDWKGPLLQFNGGETYLLRHHLEGKPRWWQLYLSFDESGAQDGGELAPASGNQAVVTDIDEATLTVKNDSCVNYYLVVTAGTGLDEPTPP